MRLGKSTTIQRRYTVLRALGKGGMAQTYLVDDELLGLRLALKVLRFKTEPLVRAFQDEFARLSGLFHPHLSHVHDFGTELTADGSFHFYTADFVDGVTLDQFAFEHGITTALQPLVHAVMALDFLHRLGLRHGDFKPQNILVTPDGRGVLTDLGCARPIDSQPDGTLWGTREFMAPELLDGQRADARADLYAVGVTLRTLAELASAPNVDVSALANRLTEGEPAARPAEAKEVLEALGVTHAEPGPPLSRAPRLIGRRAELQLFQRFLQNLLNGEFGPRALIVHGPLGIGRSRLLQEIKWRAQLMCSVVEGVEGVQESAISPLMAMLGRGLDDSFSSDLAGVLRARERLVEESSPTVYILDDALDNRTGDRALVDAFLRTLDASVPALFVMSGPETLSVTAPNSVRIVDLPPLTEAEIGQWARDAVSARDLPHFQRLTGGIPVFVEGALAKLQTGELHEDDLGLDTSASLLSFGAPLDLGALTLEDRRCLGLLALIEGWSSDVLERLGLDQDSLVRLHRSGWIQRDRSRWKLTRATDAARILGALDADRVRALHSEIATGLAALVGERVPAARDEAWRSLLLGKLTHYLARGGRLSEAERALSENASLATTYPLHWRQAAESVASRTRSIDSLLITAEIHQLSGHPERGLTILEELLNSRPRADLSSEVLARSYRQQAACLVKLGEPERAVEHLRAALDHETSDASHTSTMDLLCRTLIQQGRYRDALELAQEALDSADDQELVALLHENVGVALSYLGDLSSAREHLGDAVRHQSSAGQPRARVRLLSYQAIVEFRAGDIESAIDKHRSALEVAESHGLLDLVASTALNLGTACQQHGDWGPALSSYERGLQIATAQGKRSTEISLRFNVANLQASIGLFERAKIGARTLRDAAREAKLSYFVGWTAALLGEIALHQGRFGESKHWLEKAKETFVALDAAREIYELDLYFVEVFLSEDKLQAAAEQLKGVRESITGHDAADLDVWARMLGSRILMRQGAGAEAIMMLEDAAHLSRNVGQRVREAEIELLLSEAFDKQASRDLAERHRRRARERWDRIAASLPVQLRDTFWGHPRRTALAREGTDDKEHRALGTLDLRKFFEVNRKINSTLSAKKVLEYALDSAIELAGAERGLILLADDVGRGKGRNFRVRVARNLDRERLGRSHLKYSRSIAEAVIATDTPVLTADAEGDDRFEGAESIHAMRLKSVACVPIRSLTTAIGALYVDNRFHQGRFGAADLDLLMAFSDQVAIALRNAQLHSEVERRTTELQAEQREVKRLMHGQAAEIDRLQDEIRAKQEVLEYRYDYSNIIGRSAVMREIFATLDRIIDTTLPVLIQGESGTGKDLCARAIHFNGPRRERPFVTINCAALPDSLLESELFGHVRGAFTGADRDRDGLFIASQGGSLFLDEVGEMSLTMQAKLLRALEEQKVRPLGSSELISVDLRTIFATNRSLRDEVEAGRFRRDLYYRIAVVELSLPPLRERSEDIPELAEVLLKKLAEKAGGPGSPQLSRAVVRLLSRYPWPGNVRQLENVLAKAMIMATGETLTPRDIELPDALQSSGRALDRQAYEAEEERRILAALTATRWNISEVSRRLDIPRNTLYRKLERYKITRPR